MRILIASDSFPPKVDGVSAMAGIVAAGLSARGHRVAVIAATQGPRRHEGATVVRAASLPLPFYPEVRATAPFGLARRVVGRFRPEAVLVLTTGPVGVAVARALPESVPMVHIFTTDIPKYLRDYHLGLLARPYARLVGWLTSRANVTLCPTEVALQTLAAEGHERLAIWARGVDTALFHPSRADANMRSMLAGGEPEKPLVLYVGRLAREKRLLDLYRAARMLPGLRFALVGDGPQRSLLERKFAEVPSVFTGYLRGVELATAFASADIFAFPSDTETFGQVVLQAMASGLPAVVAAGTAPAELVKDGASGIHVPARDPQALARVLDGLAGDGELRRALGCHGVSAAARYSWDSLLGELEEGLVRAVESPPARSGGRW